MLIQKSISSTDIYLRDSKFNDNLVEENIILPPKEKIARAHNMSYSEDVQL
jgi:hypothetical protein